MEGQLLQNTGFETGDLSGWTNQAYLFEKDVYTFSSDTHGSEQSSYSLKVATNVASSFKRIVQLPAVSVTAGASYRLSAWLKTTGTIDAFVSVNNSSTTSKSFTAEENHEVGVWRQVTYDFTVKTDKTAIAVLLRSNTGVGTILWDDISLVQIESIGGAVNEGAEATVIANFESQSLPSGTTQYYNDIRYSASNYAFEILNGGFKGNHSLQLANQNKPLEQEVSVVGGTEYKFSAVLRRNAGSATIKAEFYDANGTLIEDTNNVGVILQDASPTTDDWKKVEKAFTAPQSTVKLKLSIQKNSGTIYVDDISLTGQGLIREYNNGSSKYEALTSGEDVLVTPYELLKGGNFTDLSQWTRDTGKIDTNFTVVTDGYEGNAVKYTADSSYSNLILRQSVNDIAGGSEYTVSGWMKVLNAGTNRKPAVKLEFSTEEGRVDERLNTLHYFDNEFVIACYRLGTIAATAPLAMMLHT